MEQAPKPMEAAKPKSKTMWIVAAAIIVILVVGVVAYLLTRPPTGTAVSIWENPGAGCTAAGECGYRPDPLNITAGTTVTWTNDGALPHTATACHTANPSPTGCPIPNNQNLPNFDVPGGTSTLSGGGGSGSFKFDTPGTYYYYCRIHPTMHGTVIVR